MSLTLQLAPDRRPPRRMRRTTGAALAAGLALAGLAYCAPAARAAVTTLGPGNFADVAVEPSGTAHITWKLPLDTTGYCRLPLAASACDIRHELVTPGSDPDERPHLQRRASDGALFVLDEGEDPNGDDIDGTSLWLHVSVDNGATWAPARKVSQGVHEPDATALTADGTAIDVISGSPSRGLFQRIPLDGSLPAGAIDLGDPFSAADIVIDSALVALPGGRSLAVMGTSDAYGFRFFGAGNIHDQAAWSSWPGRALPGGESGHVLVTGVRGTFLVSRNGILDQVRGNQPLLVRRLGRGGFERARSAGGKGYSNSTINAAQDPTGTLHLAYHDTTGESVRYTRTRGRCWVGRPTTLYRAFRSHMGVRGLRVDAGAPTRGMAVWHGGDGVVRAVALRGGDRPASRRERRCRQ